MAQRRKVRHIELAPPIFVKATMPQSYGMDIVKNQNGGIQPQANAPLRTDSEGEYGRNLKEESRRNKKFRFRKRVALTRPAPIAGGSPRKQIPMIYRL
jgi:hypothetical protein